MNWRNFIYNSIMASLPKNIVQFFVGFILFAMIFNQADFALMLMGLAGFVLSYSSIYLLNDIKDVEEDKQDPMKIQWKMIANGTLSARKAIYLYILLIVSGLFVSLMVSVWFAVIMVLLIIINLIYSMFKLKKWMPIASIFLLAMQFLKFSSGWFVMTSSLSLFPFWLVMTLALAYTAIFVGYKAKFKREQMKKQKKLFVVLALLLLASFVLSIIVHSFPLSMLMLLGLCIVWIIFSRIVKIKHYTRKTMLLFYISILPMIVLSFLVLAIPITAEINENINNLIDGYKDSISEAVPWLTGPIKSIGIPFTRFSDLNEILDFSHLS
ncbi:MAG: UbiA family prenyltransferase [Nanoarchaeota archaeon]